MSNTNFIPCEFDVLPCDVLRLTIRPNVAGKLIITFSQYADKSYTPEGSGELPGEVSSDV